MDPNDGYINRTMAYQKCIRTMAACDTMHTRHRWYRRCHWTWRQIYDSFAIRSWTCNSLRRIFTDEQTIARTSDILLARRGITNRLRKFQFESQLNLNVTEYEWVCLCVGGGRVEFTVASWHWWHLTTCCSRLFDISIIAWHTRHVTIGTPPCGNCWYGGGTSPGPIDDTVVWSSPTFGYIVSAFGGKTRNGRI